MSYNIIDIIKDELLGSAEHVDRQTYINRVTICQTCHHLKNNIPFSGGTCGICGCFVKGKSKYKQSSCPDNPPRWIGVN